MEQIYSDSNYRFTDPIRFFKANDPYYFEVDNIPLKQLQENCLWLKDQLQKLNPQLTSIKRVDIDELRPYVSGGDRVVRVKPGRYTARVNDASTRTPLSYLRKVTGDIAGEVDVWAGTLPSEGASPNSQNLALQTALDSFKSTIAFGALGMNGLAERAFTWAIKNSDYPIDTDGADLGAGPGIYSYSGDTRKVPFLITQALLWLRSPEGLASAETILQTYKTSNELLGFNELPKTENYFIKAWRGVTRLAVVDVEDEITIEVPPFNSADFSYIDENGEEVEVPNVTQRIDLVFIYSKPIDVSSTNIITSTGKQTIIKPALGIIRGAGIKNNFAPNLPGTAPGIVAANDSILAHPGDQTNIYTGFTSTSANELEYSIRGSFPSPDDILNIAPLISEKLEDTAIELVGQSILPVAYVFVQSNSQVVLTTDLIDIRPFFRTAELSYNERAGIAGAFPQLSLANPAVGKAQMDYELRRINQDLRNRIELIQQEVPTPAQSMGILATGYVFGGWYFGPEGAILDYYRKDFADDTNTSNDSLQYLRNFVTSKYAFGGESAPITIPAFPDWDLANWCSLQNIQNKGTYPNDYINTFIGIPEAIVAGSYSQGIPLTVVIADGGPPANYSRQSNFSNMYYGTDTVSNSIINNSVVNQGVTGVNSQANFHYISKKIKFNRPSWLGDYKIDIDFINCLAQNNNAVGGAGSYFGHWIEKGFDEFTIYIAFVGPTNNVFSFFGNNTFLGVPFPSHQSTTSVANRGGNGFSCFVVPVSDILYSNPNPLGPSVNSRAGYYGNPRIGKCTYPTIMWTFTGIPTTDSQNYLYGNLNDTGTIVNLKGYSV